MTAEKYRQLALALPETAEGSHMGNVDFRVRGRIFATLHPPRLNRGALKLTIEQQKLLITAEPPVSGLPSALGAVKVGRLSNFSAQTAQLFGARSKWRGTTSHRNVSPRSSTKANRKFSLSSRSRN